MASGFREPFEAQLDEPQKTLAVLSQKKKKKKEKNGLWVQGTLRGSAR